METQTRAAHMAGKSEAKISFKGSELELLKRESIIPITKIQKQNDI